MVERLKMAGEGNTSQEAGSTATLTAPNTEGAQGQKSPSSGVVTEPTTPVPPPFEHAFTKEPEYITNPSIGPENVNPPDQQPAEQPTGVSQEPQDQDRAAMERMEWEGGVLPPDRGGGGSEGEPPGPENIWGPEFRERGISIAREIIDLEARPYEIKYNAVNGPRLDQLYEDWKSWVAQNRSRAFNRKPFDPSIFTQAEMVPIPVEPIPEQDLTDLESPRNLLEAYNKLRIDPNATEASIREVEGQLSRYFLEAKRLGLLTGIDSSLLSIYVDIMRGVYQQEGREGRGAGRRLSAAEIWTKIEESKEAISKLGERSFQALRRSDRGRAQQITPQLEGIWDVYTELAVDRFSLLLNGGGLVDAVTIGGEFNFNIRNPQELRQAIPSDEELRVRAGDADEYKRLLHKKQEWLSRNVEVVNALDREIYREMAEDQELYWRPTWSSYFEVTARIPEQFDIAVETFTQWIRSGLTKSPQELFQRVNGFIDALTTAGQRERANVPPSHIKSKNQELRGLISVLGGNHANEHYNNPYLKQFLEYGAQDEGPERYVVLGKANRGKVANVLWKFDNDPRFELFYSPHGSRGQLMAERNPIEMEQLQEQIMNMLILETMAVEIKGYHPDDQEKRVDEKGKLLEENLAEVVNFQSDEDFKNLYEGFDQTDQDDIYQELFQKQALINRAQELQRQVNEGLLPANLVGADRTIYELLTQGRLGLKPAEAQYLERLIRVQRMQEAYAAGRFDLGVLRGEDRRMYDEANNAVTLAYEMYGVMGEKAKRGGGVLLADRENPDGTTIKDLLNRPIVDYLPVGWAEKFVHFAENWTKATYGTSGEDLDPKIQEKIGRERLSEEEYQRLQDEFANPNTTEQRKNELEGILRPKGISADELQYRVDQARRMAIWALKIHGFEAKLWDFTLLRDGKPIDPNTVGYYKDYHGDPYGIDKYTDNDVQKYRYCVPENPRILGYNSEEKEVILVFDNDGKPIVGDSTGLKFDENGQAVIYNQPTETQEIEIEGAKQQKRRERITFDNLNRNTKADRVLLKMPGYPDGKPVDFDTATHHIYSRWTAHPYWGYQEEDTGLLLTPQVFEAAKRIRSGQSRPEDEEPHAAQLLIVDPTLERIAHFPHRESREDKIALNAVEESYQGHWNIRDELLQIFLPDGPDIESARTAFVLQDFGGSTKEWYNLNFEAARWANMKVRRARSLTAVLPLHYSSMSETWGAPRGALDVLRMMNYGELGEKVSYRMVGQFALEKWINQISGAQDVYDALFGYVSEQEKRSREGYGEKPNNDADSLQKWAEKYGAGDFGNRADVPSTSEDVDNQYINAVREAMGRPEVSQQRMRVLETDMRGERAPLNLKGIDIWERNTDGGIRIENSQRVYNQRIDLNRDTGSSRHSGSKWFWRMVRWQRSNKPGEGQDLYRDSAMYFALMDDYMIASKRLYNKAKREGIPEERAKLLLQTRWEWLLGKINR